jgi:hypothetical protein
MPPVCCNNGGLLAGRFCSEHQLCLLHVICRSHKVYIMYIARCFFQCHPLKSNFACEGSGNPAAGTYPIDKHHYTTVDPMTARNLHPIGSNQNKMLTLKRNGTGIGGEYQFDGEPDLEEVFRKDGATFARGPVLFILGAYVRATSCAFVELSRKGGRSDSSWKDQGSKQAMCR